MTEQYSTNMNLVPVTGRYLGTNGAPIAGTVSFTPIPDRLIDSKALVTVIGRKRTFTLDATGRFHGKLPPTDDPDIVPVGFTYLYQENFEGGTDYQVRLPVIYDITPIDVPSIIPSYINPGVNPDVVSRQEWDALVMKVEMLIYGIDGGSPSSVQIEGAGLDGGGV